MQGRLFLILMTIEDKIVKVKSTRFIQVLIFAMAIFPISFMFLIIVLNISYLVASLATLTGFGLAIYLTIRYIKRQEDSYEIIADKFSITIPNEKTYDWKDIEDIKAFSRRPLGHRMTKRYIQLILKTEKTIVLNATHYDICNKDLRKELLTLKAYADNA
jgi:hypothetical protein